ncbi:hypothetical protein Bbelb_228680 [Branchiostoma belcheri]|nr:hypothetical protein Bbelb_228680 [Branchiostoma belcheri]
MAKHTEVNRAKTKQCFKHAVTEFETTADKNLRQVDFAGHMYDYSTTIVRLTERRPAGTKAHSAMTSLRGLVKEHMHIATGNYLVKKAHSAMTSLRGLVKEHMHVATGRAGTGHL